MERILEKLNDIPRGLIEESLERFIKEFAFLEELKKESLEIPRGIEKGIIREIPKGMERAS